jgi:hypothetical protein
MDTDLPFDFGDCEPTRGVLFKSHVAKVKEMKRLNWEPMNRMRIVARPGNAFSLSHAPTGPERSFKAPARRATEVARHPNFIGSAKHQKFLDECRGEARVRARAAETALPDGDFWARAEWLERTYDVVCGLICSKPGSGTKKRKGKVSKGMRKQKEFLRQWMASGSERESSSDAGDGGDGDDGGAGGDGGDGGE